MAKDRGLNNKIEEILSLMKDMAGKSNLSRSEPRYEEMLSIMKEIAGKAMDQTSKEGTEVTKEEVSWAGESRMYDKEDQGKMNIFSLLLKVKRGMKTIREKRNMNSLDLEEAKIRTRQTGRMKRRIKRRPGRMKVKNKMRRKMKGRGKLKYVRGRSRSMELCELSDEKEEKEVKIRKVES